MQKAKLWLTVITAGLLVALSWSWAFGQDAPRINPETLKSWLSDPQVIIVDVRQPSDWESSTKKIKGAIRQEPKDVKVWAATLPKDKKIVLYCA